MIIAPFFRDAMRFKEMMLRKGEFSPEDKIYVAYHPEQLRGFRLGEGMDEVQTWFIEGNWPVSRRADIDRMIAMMNLARAYSGGDIRRWYT